MMGTGKTHWAQRLAPLLGITWVDLDAQVENAADMSVHEIFETEGELFFRKKEREVLQQLAEFDDVVIATGGGTPAFFDNMEWMNHNGITIWLDEPVEVLAKRVIPEKKHRPLVRGVDDEDMKDFLAARLAEREKYYSLAAHRLRGAEITDEALLECCTQGKSYV